MTSSPLTRRSALMIAGSLPLLAAGHATCTDLALFPLRLLGCSSQPWGEMEMSPRNGLS